MRPGPSRPLIAFVDEQVLRHVAFAQALTAALPPGAMLQALSGRASLPQQMAACMHAEQRPAAIHLVSHGQPGGLWLGGQLLDAAALEQDAAAWRAVGDALAPDGDILLYGCEVAQGESGQNFVQALARLTGAHVAASARPTGAKALGGDAVLEVHTGPSAPAVLLSQADFDRAGVLLATLPTSISPFTGSWFHTSPVATVSQAGNVASSSEIDTYFFAVEATGTHLFTLTPSAGLDVQFRLYDQTGAALSLTQDLFGNGGTEVLSVQLTAGQFVYVGVSGFGSTTGDYTFTLQSAAPTITAMNTPGPGYTALAGSQLNNAGDIDFFSVTAPSGTTSLNLSLVPTGFNAVLRLYNASGTVLQTINSTGSGGTETLSNYAVTAGTTYYIGVSADNISAASGDYTLSADFNPDDPGHPPASVTPGSGTRLRLNPFGDDSREAAIVTRSEVDLYRFYAATAGQHVISVTDAGVDIMFRVYGADGQPLGATVDVFGTVGVFATETTTVNLAGPGWVYVAVSGYESETGNYTVAVNGPSATATTVATPGLAYTGSANGSIGQLGEQDYFRLTAPAGTSTLTVSLAPHGADVAIYDSAGSEIAYAQNGFGSTQVNVTAGSDYYVAVHGVDATGAYTLGADFNPDDPGDPPASVVPGTQVFTFRPNVNGDDGVGNGIFSRSQTQVYAVRVDNPGSFTFTMESAANSQLRVYGSDGQPLTSIIDAQGSGGAETVTVTLPAGYAYVAAGLAGSDTGPYSLLVNGPSYVPTLVTLAQSDFTATVQAEVSTLQAKFFAVTAPAGATSLTLSASASTTGLSGAVTLFGSDGSSAVDSLSNLPRTSSGIPIVAGQQYYVRVLNFSNANDALVTVNLDFNPDDPGDPPASVVPGAQTFTFRPNVNGDDGVGDGIFSRSQTRLYAVRVDNPGSFTFTMESAANSQLRVYGSNGQPLTPIIDAQGSGGAETVTVTLPAGYAYVATGLAGSDTGTYFLRINGPSYVPTPVTLAQPNFTATVQAEVTTLQAKFWTVTAPAGATSLEWSASASITGLSGSVTLYRANGSSPVDSLSDLPRSSSNIPIVGGEQYVVRVLNFSNANDALVTFNLDFSPDANSAPTAQNASANATEDTVLNGTLPAATDVNGDPITYTLAGAAANGTAVVNANGSYSYRPNANFNGSDSFGFSVADNKGGSNSYTVSITVAAVNDAPVLAVPLTSQSATVNSAFSFIVPLGTFTDVDNATLTYSATLAGGGGLPGWLSFNPATRAFSGTPAAGNVGTLNLSVTASDGVLSASSGFALVVNAAPNVAPIASNASANATEDTVLTGNLPAASDADGDLITYALVTAATSGTAVVNANGFYRYTPNANFNGSDSFGYTVSDDRGGSNSYSVSVTVASVNDAPVVALPLTSQSATANSAFSFSCHWPRSPTWTTPRSPTAPRSPVAVRCLPG